MYLESLKVTDSLCAVSPQSTDQVMSGQSVILAILCLGKPSGGSLPIYSAHLIYHLHINALRENEQRNIFMTISPSWKYA